MSLIPSILSEFALPGEVHSVERHEGGHINDSFRVVSGAGLAERTYLLQRLNLEVFPDPEAVMSNFQIVTAHLAGAVRRRGLSQPERRVPQLVPTRGGGVVMRDAQGGVWRLLQFIEGTRSTRRAESIEDARGAGRAVGQFQALLADLSTPLAETIPGFHDTRARMDALQQAVAEDPFNRLALVSREVGAILSRREEAERLEVLREAGRLETRVVHNDAKIANVLFDKRTGAPLCMVDLDTVMPGLVLHDFGDLVRSIATNAAEDEPDVRRVAVRSHYIEAAMEGYLQEAGSFLTPVEKQHLGLAGRVIALEQAARFLTDFLEGDHYYQTTRPNQNLDRARAQYAVYEGLSVLG
ncbi:MAG: phosphotransferase [Gemmatimonadales bacterium]|nr:phosphotransferase [Gemmatimonadales bacterium]